MTSPLGDEVIRTTGAFMTGGRLITDDYGSGRSKPYGGAWRGPIFVLTHRDPATAPDPSPTYLSGDIRDAVDTGLRAATGKNLVVTGGSVPPAVRRGGTGRRARSPRPPRPARRRRPALRQSR